MRDIFVFWERILVNRQLQSIHTSGSISQSNIREGHGILSSLFSLSTRFVLVRVQQAGRIAYDEESLLRVDGGLVYRDAARAQRGQLLSVEATVEPLDGAPEMRLYEGRLHRNMRT